MVPSDVPYDRKALIRYALAIVGLGVGAVLMLVGEGDIFGREPGALVRLVIGVGTLGVCVWLGIGVIQRAGSDDPAIAFGPDVLRLHVHPGRPLELRLDEITGVSPVRRGVGRFDGRRLVLGKEFFEISTSRTGVRALWVLVGATSSGVELSEARDRCHRWWTARSRPD